MMNVALQRDPEAKKLYEQLKADMTLKVCQKLFRPLDHIKVEGWAKRLAKEAGCDYRKGPPAGNQMVVMRELLKGSQRIIKRYAGWFSVMAALMPWWNHDMQKFGQDLNEFILVAFNRKSDRVRGKANAAIPAESGRLS